MGRRQLRVELLQYTENPEQLVALAAKLCYSPSGMEELQRGVSQRDQAHFISKLSGMGHLTPVEHASFTFGIEGVSRSLLAQITRHRIASFSVKSQRYVSEDSASNADGVFNYVIPPRIVALGPGEVQEFERQMAQIQQWYDQWLKKLAGYGDGAKEDARFVLPNAAETKLVVTMNARELLHFFSLRCCNRAQWEIRALATEMLRQVRQVAPVLFRDAGPRCLKGPCPEGEMCCGRQAQVREEFEKL
ncbi:FAD-dependent thymidylate synthase [Desulfallas thermosapovorans]|uniref:Flavin-dependent thymidylate synthase n=1 Tax=Desulfallas thermosapovorans DSM 6562 TaxID=1121431 RepID=A0A5S4ZPZ8_9FIRM|nr:FAD-dependent thymidylate synthase [Desulfallas thermosapovorans]TYO94656.1 thymidylate synthase (FAD) [Desulfallas thermosapovorans DSM 6562]